MRIFIKNFLPLFLAVFILIAIFFSGIINKKEDYFVQASFWNIIKAWVTINPLEVDVSAPATAGLDKVFKVEARVINKGEEKIKEAKGEIFLPEGLVLLKKKTVQVIGIIPPKKEKKISWTVRGIESGWHVITVSASGELKGNLISAEDSTTIEIKEDIFPGWQDRFNFFKRFFDFFRESFTG